MSENKAMPTIDTAPEAAVSRYTIEYILEQLEKIAADTTYLLEAIKESSNPIGAQMVGDARAIGLGNMVESREQTNQRLIALYTEMYHDLKPTPATGKQRLVDELLKVLNDPSKSSEDKDRAKSILQGYMVS